MQEQQEQIVKILLKSVNNEELSSEEQQLLNNWINKSPHNKKVFEEISDPHLLESELKSLAGYDRKLMWKQIERGMHGDSRKGRLVYFFKTTFGRVAAAAVFILLCAGAYVLFIKSPSTPAKNLSENKVTQKPIDVAPGTDGAILKLADGSTIVLDNAANGTLTKEGNVSITKKDGQVIYNNSQLAANSSELSFNTMTTPKGRQYRVVLADGSVVFLNAASSIKYPTAFSGNERRVSITGEAYFEVAKDPKKPFIAEVNGMEVEVLGTHFDINAYADESLVRTTLLEGAVKVHSNGKTSFLKPGQQARLEGDGEVKVVNDINTEEVMAWKNGSFQFEGADIGTIMRQVERWYDIEVVFDGKVTPRKFYVDPVPRSVPVSKLLKWLEDTKEVSFKIEENKITVSAP